MLQQDGVVLRPRLRIEDNSTLRDNTPIATMNQGDALGADRLFGSNCSEAFARLGFHIHLLDGNVEDIGNPLLDGLLVLSELGTFGKHDAIEIVDLITGKNNFPVGDGQHVRGTPLTIGFVCVGEQVADIA